MILSSRQAHHMLFCKSMSALLKTRVERDRCGGELLVVDISIVFWNWCKQAVEDSLSLY